MNLHMCSKFGANRPSRFVAFPEFVLRLVRLFADVRADLHKTRKKTHLYIENYNSGPNMLTSTSLTFFTAIFVAFSGALAEELMIFCRHVRTELSMRITFSIHNQMPYHNLQRCRTVFYPGIKNNSTIHLSVTIRSFVEYPFIKPAWASLIISF